MRDLQGQNALVTGASGGLGRHIAAALAAAGANVAVSGRNIAALERLAESLVGFGVKTASVPVDLLHPSAAAQLVERASRVLGPLGVVVNGAGVEIASSFTEYSREQLETFLTLDLVVPMLLIREVVPGMLESGRGHVVSIGSLAGKGALPYGGWPGSPRVSGPSTRVPAWDSRSSYPASSPRMASSLGMRRTASGRPSCSGRRRRAGGQGGRASHRRGRTRDPREAATAQALPGVRGSPPGRAARSPAWSCERVADGRRANGRLAVEVRR